MKKMIAFILVLSFSVFAFSAVGEELELSTMSYGELKNLRDRIDSEMCRRPEFTDETGYGGILIGGENINVGSYVFTCVGEVIISMWKSEREFERSYDPIMYSNYSDGELVAVSIGEGTRILIEDGAVIIQLATEDWVPKTE